MEIFSTCHSHKFFRVDAEKLLTSADDLRQTTQNSYINSNWSSVVGLLLWLMLRNERCLSVFHCSPYMHSFQYSCQWVNTNKRRKTRKREEKEKKKQIRKSIASLLLPLPPRWIIFKPLTPNQKILFEWLIAQCLGGLRVWHILYVYLSIT